MTARFSLSPASLATTGPGDGLISTSLNGAACTAARAPVVLVGALTNASAVAAVIRSSLERSILDPRTLVACVERWTSVADEPDSLPPASRTCRRRRHRRRAR